MKSKKLNFSSNTTLASTMKTGNCFTPRNNESSFDFVSALWSSRQSGQPVLDQKIKQQIEYKQKIIESVNENMRKRDFAKDSFIKYNYNPFVTSHTQYETMKRENKSRNTQMLNIIDSMQRSQDFSFPIFNKKVDNSKIEMNRIRQEKSIKSAKNLNYLHFKQSQNYFRSQRNSNTPKAQVSFNLQNKTKKVEPFKMNYRNRNEPNARMLLELAEELQAYQSTEIDSITSIKQESFFSVKNIKFNVFKIPQESQSFGNYETLKGKNFQFYGIVEKLSNVKIPYIRELSTFGRGLITRAYKGSQVIGHHISQHESNPVKEQLNFWDIMGVASNRVTPEQIQKLLLPRGQNQKGFDFETSSLAESDDQVAARADTATVMNNHIFESDSKQVELYNLLQLTEQEERQKQKYEWQNQKLAESLKFQSELQKNMINERRIHESLSMDREGVFLKFLSDKEMSKEITQLVRYNKYKKDKRQLIKIRLLKDMLEKKNIHEEARGATFKHRDFVQHILQSR